MKFYLRDIKKEMVSAWKHFFKDEPDVEISCGDIFAGPKADAIVSPANSFAEMSGGIDYIYSEYFGWDLEKRLQKQLEAEHDGELPVGQATIIATNNENYPWLISAPTMRVPMIIKGTVNAYLAFRAAIREVHDWNNNVRTEDKIRSILCPGLGTAVGRMPYNVAAKQMYYAYRINEKKDPMMVSDLIVASDIHLNLINENSNEIR